MNIQVLDVSLREGGHCNNFQFSPEDIHCILKALDKSGIEFVEVGYRNHPVVKNLELGQAAFCQDDYLNYCRPLLTKAKMVVLAYSNWVTIADIAELKEAKVDLFRLCMNKEDLDSVRPFMKEAKTQGLKLSVNLIQMAKYSLEEIQDFVEKIAGLEPEVIYLADSSGSMLPEKVKQIYTSLVGSEVALGFHAHDNLGLAQANAIAALDAGAEYMDFSLAGCGKGIGNLKTEFFCAYLQAIGLKRYYLSDLVFASNYLQKLLRPNGQMLELEEIQAALKNLGYRVFPKS